MFIHILLSQNMQRYVCDNKFVIYLTVATIKSETCSGYVLLFFVFHNNREFVERMGWHAYCMVESPTIVFFCSPALGQFVSVHHLVAVASLTKHLLYLKVVAAETDHGNSTELEP